MDHDPLTPERLRAAARILAFIGHDALADRMHEDASRMEDTMSAEVIPISESSGPPETIFEREAVETLLTCIRNFREQSGGDPQGMVLVLTRDDIETLHHRYAHFRCGGPTSRFLKSHAAVLLAEAALAP